MRIVVASGKGGTGKTTVATSLALSLADMPHPAINKEAQAPERLLFLDCDVEAPNAHLFLTPVFRWRKEVGILIPRIDETGCTFCGRCAEVCQFHALAIIGPKALLFPELCHGCGSCMLNCPEQAIDEELKPIGILEAGPAAAGIYFARGVLNVGQAMAVPVIHQLKKWEIPVQGNEHHSGPGNPENVGQTSDRQIIIIDAPPGTSCPVVETMREADFALLVTEPTPFGLHDLQLMVEVLHQLKIPAGVVINRDGIGNPAVEQFCAQAGLPVLMRIALERKIGQGIARGEPLIAIRPEYKDRFRELYKQIQDRLRKAKL
jgi:MinD superfamily P-loop ATPase